MGVAVQFYFLQPILEVEECIPSGDVVDEEGPDGTPIVGAGDGSEIFLSGGIPDLQFDIFVFDGYGFGTKLDTDGDIVGGSGFVFDELEDDTGLADAGIADDYELEKVMIRIHENIIM